MKTPTDYLSYGAAILIVGAAVAGLLAVSTVPIATALSVAGVAGLTGGVLLTIGCIALGVRIGVRAANDD
jgi:hypothetical protein